MMNMNIMLFKRIVNMYSTTFTGIVMGFSIRFTDLFPVLSVLKTVDIRSPKTVISVHFSYSLPMAMQIY